MTATRPNFFIVGAPKCGTTAMNDYLAQHPDIFMARKEMHFFGSDLAFAPSVERRNLSAYLAEFSGARGQPRIGEASVWYLYSQRAAQEIKAFAPDARIIIMLRSPVDMLYSNYHQFLYNGNEDLPTFRQALAAEADRRQGRRIPESAQFAAGLYYTQTVRYADQVQRCFDAFGRDQVHVIIYDDFKADTAAAYNQTLQFLGVSTAFQPEFEVINPNKRTRSAALRNFLNAPPAWYKWLQPVRRRLLPKRLRSHLYGGVRRMNTEYVRREPLEDTLRRELQAAFRPEVEKLSILLDRDLSGWAGHQQTHAARE